MKSKLYLIMIIYPNILGGSRCFK